MKIFLVAYFKFDSRGMEYGFQRMDLQTFYTDLKEAKDESRLYFCDEAGWYDGILIEEREEGNLLYSGRRILFLQKGIKFLKIEEPEYFKCVTRII